MLDVVPRPVLFLDIDGPLIPFGVRSGRDPDPRPPLERIPGANPLAARLDPALGPLLSALPCELVWATTWTDEANRSVGPVLGLPTLAVVDWPDRADSHIDTWFGLHWKTRTLVEWAAGRAFIWVDDELGDHDREWVSDHCPGPALLHRVDSHVGLQRHDVAIFSEWLVAVGE